MADTQAAIDFILKQEDSALAGQITTLPGEGGVHPLRPRLALPPRPGRERLLRDGRNAEPGGPSQYPARRRLGHPPLQRNRHRPLPTLTTQPGWNLNRGINARVSTQVSSHVTARKWVRPGSRPRRVSGGVSPKRLGWPAMLREGVASLRLLSALLLCLELLPRRSCRAAPEPWRGSTRRRRLRIRLRLQLQPRLQLRLVPRPHPARRPNPRLAEVMPSRRRASGIRPTTSL